MVILTGTLILALNTVVSLYYIYNKNPAFLAYIIFYQYIQLIIFQKLEIYHLNFAYFIVLFSLYILRGPKVNLSEAKLLYAFINPVMISIYLILFMFILHNQIIGIDSSNIRGHEIILEFFLFTVPILPVCLLFFLNENDFEKLMNGIILYGFIFFLTVFFVGDIQHVVQYGRRAIRQEALVSPLLLSNVASNIFIVSVIRLNSLKKRLTIIVHVIAILSSIYFMIISASRAPLIFLFLSMTIYYVTQNFQNRKKMLYLSVFYSICIIVLVLSFKYDNLIWNRFQELRYYDESFRYFRIEIAMDLLKHLDIWVHGLGPNGFGSQSGYGYAHNYIIETLVDYGFLGLLSTSLLIGYGIYYSIRLLRDNVSYKVNYIAVVWLFTFFGKLTSGDITDARYFHFVSCLLVSTVYIVYKRTPRNLSKEMRNHPQ